jgi:hypothetical protein
MDLGVPDGEREHPSFHVTPRQFACAAVAAAIDGAAERRARARRLTDYAEINPSRYAYINPWWYAEVNLSWDDHPVR